MRILRKTLYGKSTSKGELKIHLEDLEAFAKIHPNRGLILRVEVQPIEPSERLTNYFFGYVVKEVAWAYYEKGCEMSDAYAYDMIREACPVFWEERRVGGEWKVRMREWEELDKDEAHEVVEWVQRWAAENLDWVIDDAD